MMVCSLNRCVMTDDVQVCRDTTLHVRQQRAQIIVYPDFDELPMIYVTFSCSQQYYIRRQKVERAARHRFASDLFRSPSNHHHHHTSQANCRLFPCTIYHRVSQNSRLFLTRVNYDDRGTCSTHQTVMFFIWSKTFKNIIHNGFFGSPCIQLQDIAVLGTTIWYTIHWPVSQAVKPPEVQTSGYTKHRGGSVPFQILLKGRTCLSRHPSLLLSFTLGSKPTFSTNSSHRRFLFTYWTASR